LFLGQSPAKNYIGLAFLGTKSGRTLFSWIRDSGTKLDQCGFANASEYTSKELRELIRSFDGIVLCGKFAAKAFNNANLTVPCVTIEHPSGLNRNLNDPLKVKNCISLISSLRESLNLRGQAS
jgi:hypothetical protein